MKHLAPRWEAPPGWKLLEERGPWPFVTWRRYRRPDGSEAEWHSQRARRGTGGQPLPVEDARARLVLHLTYVVAAGFAVGSVLFALGSAGAIGEFLSAFGSNVTYFVGALFFTGAAGTQYVQVLLTQGPTGRGVARWARPERIDWWVSVLLLLGTLWFNVLTTTEFASWLAPRAEYRLVWRPDAIGSTLFLVSGYLGLAECCHGHLRFMPASVAWWVNATNVLGCAAFGVSAVASLVLPSGQALDGGVATRATFVGAVCFFASSALIAIEVARSAPAE